MLFIHQGTAHLDIEKERTINENLRRLEITRISIAHRPEIMDGADAVLRIGVRTGGGVSKPQRT